MMAGDDIAAMEMQIYELTIKLNKLRQAASGSEVRNYRFATQSGEVSLLDLFGTRDTLLLIHNMGQGCRYCTLWADGLNDRFCSARNLPGMAGLDEGSWTPRFNYWQRPAQMDDGGKNLMD